MVKKIMRLPARSWLSKILPAALPSIFLNRKLLLALFTLLALISAATVLSIKYITRRQLERAQAALDKESIMPFEKEIRHAIDNEGMRILQSYQSARAIAQYKNFYYVATEGGLVELTSSGKLSRHYSVLDGLPDSSLTCLAVYDGKLYLGTKTAGLAQFDGQRFARYRWTDRDCQEISALAEDSGRLLIGTFAGGLISFDGKNFQEIKIGVEKRRLMAISLIVKENNRIYVGTFNNGLWIAEAGRWLHYTAANGLLSDRIVGIANLNNRLIVAADFGIAWALNGSLTDSDQSREKQFQALATLPSLSGLIVYQGAIVACKDDGELFTIAPDFRSASAMKLNDVDWNRPQAIDRCRLASIDNDLWLLSSEGIWRNSPTHIADENSLQIALIGFGQLENARMPASNIISALSIDAQGRLWAGSFRNGIDIFSASGERYARLQNGPAREINYLLWDRDEKRMLAATSQGVIAFDAALSAKNFTTADGLLSNSVTNIALLPAKAADWAGNYRNSALVLATGRGLTVGEAGRMRGLTTIQGLPSNSLYAALPIGKTIYVATLSGLAEVTDGKVTRVYKDSNSKLTHNWVTAVCQAEGRLFIGTYGGGVFELSRAGELNSFASEIGKLAVNQNAIFSDGARLYVGALDGAWIFELSSQQWIHLKDELPAPNVLSITGNGKQIFFGTTSGIAQIDIARLMTNNN
jgi:ligand-binding sensor domain-containing protein